MLPTTLWHPGARCARCGQTGWRLDERPVTRCGCVQPCPRCNDSGVVGAGVTRCVCWVARERIALLNRSGLPSAAAAPPDACGGWFARYRPEDGWPWLLACRVPDAVVAGALAQLILEIGAPVAVVQPEGPLPLVRILAAFRLQRWRPAQAERLTAHCEASGLTLVATADAVPLEGLSVGEAAGLSLWENGAVFCPG